MKHLHILTVQHESLFANHRRMHPILYSFRRCPYAMRARLALHISGVTVELREVSLRNKPESMLIASPKGSVPVLVLPEGQVIDESWDIMQWSLRQHDPDDWLGENECYLNATTALLNENDTTFKGCLDRYKYFERYPQQPQSFYRAQGEQFLQQLENRLCATRYLLGDALSIADAAIFPFIRQFSEVDQNWFAQSPYPALQRWLGGISSSKEFSAVMHKYSVWQWGDLPILLLNKTDPL
jgi:glutathione S-transferase